MELYNLQGLINVRFNRFAAGIDSFDNALNILWTDLSSLKGLVERLQALERNIHDKFSFYKDLIDPKAEIDFGKIKSDT